MSQQVTTLTFFRYQDWLAKCWAFQMMQFAHRPLQQVEGLTFYKLMGSGKGMGFNPLPDWSVYCLLQVWETEAYANHFFAQHPLVKRYDHYASERWTLYMHNISAAGAWSGGNPFKKKETLTAHKGAIAIITRATIKASKLPHFWKYVPTSQKPLLDNKGLIYTKGIGEVPILQMATFSLWKDMASVKKFAYQSKEHQVAIQKTRQLNWYKEELFARFGPFKSVGSWEGRNPLEGLINEK